MADKEKPKVSSPKTDAMRAIREARYEEAHRQPVKPMKTVKTKSVPPTSTPKK